jgi:DNA-binding transcriptional ArsR family regulator
VNERIREISQLDRLIHEPARLQILMFLQEVEEADFLYLLREGGFTQGNLSTHLSRLEDAGYIEIRKMFKGKMPLTVCRITAAGGRALRNYCSRMMDIMQGRQDSGKPRRR